MKKAIAVISLSLAVLSTNAQKELNIRDSTIIADMIDPVTRATPQGEDPAWDDLYKNIITKYDAASADRALTKAKIYYNYGKNYPAFATAIVHVTVAYEDKENLRLINKNANYVLPNSEDKAELETARGWVQHAVDKERRHVKDTLVQILS